MVKHLDIDDLAGWFALGCKARDAWRIGTEHEKIGFCMDTLRPVPYDGERSIRKLLELLIKRDWQPVYEDSNLIALTKAGASVTLEPGGQLELSGAPTWPPFTRPVVKPQTIMRLSGRFPMNSASGFWLWDSSPNGNSTIYRGCRKLVMQSCAITCPGSDRADWI